MTLLNEVRAVFLLAVVTGNALGAGIHYMTHDDSAAYVTFRGVHIALCTSAGGLMFSWAYGVLDCPEKAPETV